jgi:hypothetical protein
MTFETETFLTLEEYKKLSLRITFKKPGVRLMVAAVPVCLVLLYLQSNGSIAAFDIMFQALLITYVLLGISIPLIAIRMPAKHYASNKMISQQILFIFDDEKICHKLKGAEGFVAWEYVKKIDDVDGFLLIYTSDLYAYMVKTDKLSLEQINFIKSHVSINTK